MLHRVNQRLLNPELRRNVLSLPWLSTQTGLSPYHFAYVFKEAIEIKPQNEFSSGVLKRLQWRVSTERGGHRRHSKGLGFSSQARMTQLMRLHFGGAPSSMSLNCISLGVDPDRPHGTTTIFPPALFDSISRCAATMPCKLKTRAILTGSTPVST